MPRLSDTMTDGKVAKWHKKVGDQVKEGDILAEIETDKAVQDFESEFDGILLYAGIAEGESAPVDSILAIIGEEGEDISALTGNKEQKEQGSRDPDPGIPEDFKTEQENTSLEKAPDLDKEDTTQTENSSEGKGAKKTEVDAQNLPKGTEVINMPRLSDTMTEGKVAKWHFNVGDEVKEGDILAEMETDKAVQDFESEFDGVLLYQGVKEGDAAKVDSILAIIGPAGTDLSAVSADKPSSGANAQSEQKAESKEDKKAEPAAQKSTDAGTGTERLAISPLARKMAEEKGIDVQQLRGSGENGRIVKKDIESFTPGSAQPQSKSSEKSAAPAAKPVITGETTETPNSQIRSVIARRLSESKFTAPHYYLMIEVNMDKAIQARQEINSLPDTKISFNDMIIKAAAVALRKHPQVNSSWTDEKIIHHGDINIGVAVAIPDGLVVPVLRNTDHMTYTEISAAVKDMAARAKNKGLKANEMEGSTFSISNLGMYGIETFTSIINQPNSAILSVGAIIEKPIVRDGQLAVGKVMKLSLACDHRVVDGATGAEFLQTLKTYLEQPLTLLL